MTTTTTTTTELGAVTLTIEKPTLSAKTSPNEVWQLAACVKVMAVCFVAMSALAAAALGMTISMRFEIGELRAELVAALDSTTDGVFLSTNANGPSGFTTVSLFEGEWAPGVQMPEARSDLQSVFCAGKIVLVGGINIAGEAVATTWTFDPMAEVYDTAKASMPTARYRFGAACLDGKVYVAGGYPTKVAGDAGRCLSSVHVYDVASDSWSDAAPLGLARGDLALAAARGQIYAMGGYGYEYPYPDPANEANEAYSPTANAWRTVAPLPGGGKGDISAAEMDGIIFVPGGWNGGFMDALVAYNTSSGAWDAGLASMGRARGDKALATLDGQLYVVGGEIWSGKTEPCAWDNSTMCDVNGLPIHNCERYSPTADLWTPIAPIPDALFRFSAAAARGIVYTFGGQGHGKAAVRTASKFLQAPVPDIYVHIKEVN